MDTEQAQAVVVESVRARGYIGGWTRDQLAARQVCKLVEELAEAAEHIEWSSGQRPYWVFELQRAARFARAAFDRMDAWDSVRGVEAAISEELADLGVVLCNLAASCGVEDFMADAVKKAMADVERGVR